MIKIKTFFLWLTNHFNILHTSTFKNLFVQSYAKYISWLQPIYFQFLFNTFGFSLSFPSFFLFSYSIFTFFLCFLLYLFLLFPFSLSLYIFFLISSALRFNKIFYPEFCDGQVQSFEISCRCSLWDKCRKAGCRTNLLRSKVNRLPRNRIGHCKTVSMKQDNTQSLHQDHEGLRKNFYH